MKARIAIIIPTLNEVSYLPTLLDSLALQTLSPTKVVVVDGGSDDGTLALRKSYPKVTFLSAEKGISRQRNTGAHYVKGSSEWLLFLDADTRLPEATTLERLLHAAQRKKLQCACPRYQAWPGSWVLYLVFSIFNGAFWAGQQHFPTGIGSAILITAKLFGEIDGFDHSKIVMEDIDLIQRASNQGKFGIVPVTVLVSDRRFRRYGLRATLSQYAHMSWLLIRNRPHHFPSHTYQFGEHHRPRV